MKLVSTISSFVHAAAAEKRCVVSFNILVHKRYQICQVDATNLFVLCVLHVRVSCVDLEPANIDDHSNYDCVNVYQCH